VALAADAGVRRLVLFHHEPEHDDRSMDELLTAASREAKSRGHSVEVLAALEGMHLTL
jgi:phosphoribosyl 1,2-cyclic phosphodiesterase